MYNRMRRGRGANGATCGSCTSSSDNCATSPRLSSARQDSREEGLKERKAGDRIQGGGGIQRGRRRLRSVVCVTGCIHTAVPPHTLQPPSPSLSSLPGPPVMSHARACNPAASSHRRPHTPATKPSQPGRRSRAPVMSHAWALDAFSPATLPSAAMYCMSIW
eukprot:365841-Chlamydomonas_euryale.AAC.1